MNERQPLPCRVWSSELRALGHRDWLVWALLLPILIASCARKPAEKLPRSQQGTLIQLPVQGDFPRPGMQWSYRIRQIGFSGPLGVPSTLTFRFLLPDPKKRLWSNITYYDDHSEADGTYEQITPNYIFFHPPRSKFFGFRDLEWAPFPVATPGKPGTTKRRIQLGSGWEPHVGEVVEQTYTDLGPCRVEVPAGRFGNAWCVEGKTAKWAGQFSWVAQVGWIRMAFQSTDGRKLDLQLYQLRQTDEALEPD